MEDAKVISRMEAINPDGESCIFVIKRLSIEPKFFQLFCDGGFLADGSSEFRNVDLDVVLDRAVGEVHMAVTDYAQDWK
jgi:hypothetical protein